MGYLGAVRAWLLPRRAGVGGGVPVTQPCWQGTYVGSANGTVAARTRTTISDAPRVRQVPRAAAAQVTMPILDKQKL